MTDRIDYILGLGILAGLYDAHPSLPTGWRSQEIDLHQYGINALPAAEQGGLALAVIEQMDAPEITFQFNRTVTSAWLHVSGRLAGLPVTVRMLADDVCERRPEARRKRDRWELPPEIVAAVKARTGQPEGQVSRG
ncbi:hypothetical protein ACFYOK_37605 [Microbispora bryophytorum]|uniref:hypothetical protein n=1 Tax=Microbispora bryophytorum TaxID=1460882 RepID=UPI0033E539A6